MGLVGYWNPCSICFSGNVHPLKAEDTYMYQSIQRHPNTVLTMGMYGKGRKPGSIRKEASTYQEEENIQLKYILWCNEIKTFSTN